MKLVDANRFPAVIFKEQPESNLRTEGIKSQYRERFGMVFCNDFVQRIDLQQNRKF